ncbi:MAG: hypothetical protein JW882_02725 [Deltaproteobacteria bacterium]|nr:hypothetical protein [Deltaproteobacteria bacterium]
MEFYKEYVGEINPEVKAVVPISYYSDPITGRPGAYGFCLAISKPHRLAKPGKILHDLKGAVI